MIAPYPAWLLIFNVLPLALLWLGFYPVLKEYRATVLKCIGCSVVAGVLWDLVAIGTKIWYWPPDCCVLPRIHGLPLEETLFMVFVTALVSTITLLVRDRFPNPYKETGRGPGQ